MSSLVFLFIVFSILLIDSSTAAFILNNKIDVSLYVYIYMYLEIKNLFLKGRLMNRSKQEKIHEKKLKSLAIVYLK